MKASSISIEQPLLIAWHSRTGASEALAQAVADGAGDIALLKSASEVTSDDLLEAAGYVFVCPENLAALSGLMKDMFDRCYYPVLGRIEGRPFASIIAAGSDGENAQRQLDRIAKGWRLRRVAEPMIVNVKSQTPAEILAKKNVTSSEIENANKLGIAMQSGIEMGIF